MERNEVYTDDSALKKTIVVGSVLSGVALFALSVVMMVMIGLLLGALVLTERIARQCSEEEEPVAEHAAGGLHLHESYTARTTEPREEEAAGEIGGYDGVVIAQPAFSQAA